MKTKAKADPKWRERPSVVDTVRRCRDRGIRLRVWWGYSLALGQYAVCYGGSLADCERLENTDIIRDVTRNTGDYFCYQSPSPEWAEST